ncbi:Uncharacterised protein [Alloiococcus otitis]|uniref:CopG family transcriptional regulator n=1 Tax=Alloiococcus otitis ATCC 51267 TaxID=883081 RepID=K9EWL8_9LACT|nr:hypothetical protein [Alloiococcus otitis]EKU93625.1 hypothetical protein HMPREF9698_00920 [Alloiococcus otitis ATCC 51267]SUU80402.1 Uncharacterised protein [Alloiococcus otitis]
MEEQQSKELTVKVDSGTYNAFQAYCEESSFDQDEIVEHLMDRFVDESRMMINQMRKGYAEMANLNLEIAAEFSECDNEVNINL